LWVAGVHASRLGQDSRVYYAQQLAKAYFFRGTALFSVELTTPPYTVDGALLEELNSPEARDAFMNSDPDQYGRPSVLPTYQKATSEIIVAVKGSFEKGVLFQRPLEEKTGIDDIIYVGTPLAT
jgi:hypothetical protein